MYNEYKREIFMKMSRIFIMGWLLVSFVSINTTVFKIIRTAGDNADTHIKVRPFWDGGKPGLVELKPGESTDEYNTGPHDLKGIVYEEVTPPIGAQGKKNVCTSLFKVPFNINAGAVGGKIYVQSGGADVTFSFDTIAGSGTVKVHWNGGHCSSSE
jgi:hypothetical protein